MALNFKDFKPQSTGFFSSEKESEVLVSLNCWLDEHKVQVVNIETLVRGGGHVDFIGFRVWYQA